MEFDLGIEGRKKNQTKPSQTNTNNSKKNYIWRQASWVMLIISALTQDAETGGLLHLSELHREI